MASTSTPAFDTALHRMFHRDALDSLPTRLEKNYGIDVAKLTKLDVGVFRVDRPRREPPLVARLFSSLRPYALAEGDLAVLRYLAQVGFPAERPFGDQPLSTHEDQALLVTGFVRKAPTSKRPAHPIPRLGAMIARLHTLPVPASADRPAGALHHFAEGTMIDELRAAAEWLDSIADRVPHESESAVHTLLDALSQADGGAGLPEALVHPDPVPKNMIVTVNGPVLVDWTSAGRGPRLASLMLVLKSGWAAIPFMKGYTRRVTLTSAERDRLAGLLHSRQLIDLVFGVCHDPSTAPRKAKQLAALRTACDAKAAEILKP